MIRDMEEAAEQHQGRIDRNELPSDTPFDDSCDARVEWEDGTREDVNRYDLEVVTPLIFVNVYLVDRNYGGPEEGGWWYDSGDLQESRRCKDEAHAKQVYERKLAEYTEENRSRRSDISSVLSEGRYDVKLEAWPGVSWPVERPHYC